MQELIPDVPSPYQSYRHLNQLQSDKSPVNDLNHRFKPQSKIAVAKIPVRPKTVVFKYFSWPAKSTNVSTFELLLQISVQSNDEP